MKTLKIISVFILLVIVTISQTTRVHADFGPKRNLDVKIIGLEEDFYFDLFIETDEAEVLDQETVNDFTRYHTYANEIPALLNGYLDEDGFASYALYYPIGGGEIRQEPSTQTEQKFNIYYDVPSTFKIAIYTESGHLITSNIVETVFFDSSITYDLSHVDTTTNQINAGTVTGDISGNFPYTTMIFDITYRIILTLIIELLILLAFRYVKKNSYVKVTLTNIVTQSILTIFLIITFKYSGSLAAIFLLFLGEAIVYFIETIVYILTLKEHSKLRAFFYAIIANSASFFLSLSLLAFIL